MTTPEIEGKIKDAAQRVAGGPVMFARFHPVTETLHGEVIWEGVVSEYISLGASHVYAWAFAGTHGSQDPQFVAVLRSPSIISPLAAVREWIASQREK